jgi:hypothetical protein
VSKESAAFPPSFALRLSAKATGRGVLLSYGMNAGIVVMMAVTRKITVRVSEVLLKRAQQETGEGVSETVRQGLRLVAASRAYDQLRRRRGSIRLAVNLDQLREDHR